VRERGRERERERERELLSNHHQLPELILTELRVGASLKSLRLTKFDIGKKMKMKIINKKKENHMKNID